LPGGALATLSSTIELFVGNFLRNKNTLGTKIVFAIAHLLPYNHRMYTLYISLNKLGGFGHEAIRCETREEAKAVRAELFATRFDISFALILTNEEYSKECSMRPQNMQVVQA
jgi:hypothetical protein